MPDATALLPWSAVNTAVPVALRMSFRIVLTCVEACLDCSASRLRPYETARRPQVTMLQRLADQQVFYWNTGNPLIAYLRDRVFRTLDRNARLRHQVLTTTAGLRTTEPFSIMDRVIATGFLPDLVNMIPRTS